MVCVSHSQRLLSQEESLKVNDIDSLLKTIKDPREKVDSIIAFLNKPENQYLENQIDLANRALTISKETDYAKGEIHTRLKIGSYYFFTSDFEKALTMAHKALEMSEDLEFDKEMANSLSLIGTIHTEFSDYDNSSKYFFKSLKVFEKLKDKAGISNSLGNIGMNFFDQGNYEKALEYYNNALNYARQIDNQPAIKKQYNNIAALYATINEYDTAIVILNKALVINIAIGDKLGQGINLINIGYILMNRDNYSEALIIFQQALDLVTEMKNVRQISLCYANFGFCYYSIHEIEKSITYLQKALQEGQTINNYTIISSVAKMLNQIYLERDDTLNAYKYLMIEKMSNDSLYTSQSQKQLSKLELKYLFEKKEMERQQAQRAKNVFIIIVILSLITGLAVLGFILSRHRFKSKLVIAEKQKIEFELKSKNRELTVNLLSLIKKNEIITDISNKLEKLEKEIKASDTKHDIIKISKELRSSTEDKMFSEFTTRFQEVHAGFYEKLLKSYPNLSQNELKLCAFLRLNMSSKDIAEITNQELNSIAKARQRLRKKLMISGSETNLVVFLSQI